MLNKYIWNTYLNAGGSEIVSFFEDNLKNGLSKKYAEKIAELHSVYNPSKIINDELKDELSETYNIIQDGVYVFEEGNYSIKSAADYLYQNFTSKDDETPLTAFCELSFNIAFYSTLCACEIPELFIPYYYKFNFNVLEKISDVFDINLPMIPNKKDYKGRFFYYIKICESLNAFRKENDLSPYECCAFLYDFAPKYLGGKESYIVQNLPAPTSAFFIGGDKKDAFLSESPDGIVPWQCNPDTRAGDMIVMYLKTPVSAIDSIWRSVSIGFNDPFFYYYRCTYIAKPCKITQIPLKELQCDEVFRKLPIVKKNMQGINGVELYPSVYNYLTDISNVKLPKIDFFAENNDYDLKREKDVENKLIKPFLKKLGYSENEYVQQLYIEIGNRNHALIPDFVINPKVTNGHYSADFLIEAKYTVKSKKDLEEYKKQARSYANQLKAFFSVVASKEGVWISSRFDDYSKDIVIAKWTEIDNLDVFYDISKILGKEKFKRTDKY